jgi:hypothetical protein
MKLTSLAFSLLALSAYASAEERELRGHVTDDMCGGEHMMEGMDAKECAEECVRMGAVYALFATAHEKMFLVDDPKKLEPFAGENVVVKGTLSEDGKTLRIASIERAP